MQAYVKDLYAWEEEMKSKEDSLRKGKAAASKKTGVPAVRGQAAPVVGSARPELMRPAAQLSQGAHAGANGAAAPTTRRRKKKTAVQAAASGSAAGHTYDHFRDKWDKFDVDAALRDADEDTEYETDTEDEGAQLTERSSRQLQPAAAPGPAIRSTRSPEDDAEFWRAKGNEYFKFGDLKKAKECYTSALAALPGAAAYANRGLVCLKLREWAAAERDCTEALAMDPGYVKALQRRAAARKELGNVVGALEDLDAALRLLPRDAGLSRDLRATLRSHAAAEGLVVPSANLVQLTTLAPAADGGADDNRREAPVPAASAAAADSARSVDDGGAVRAASLSTPAVDGAAMLSDSRNCLVAAADGAAVSPSKAESKVHTSTEPSSAALDRSATAGRIMSSPDVCAPSSSASNAPAPAARRPGDGPAARAAPEAADPAATPADVPASLGAASQRLRDNVRTEAVRDGHGVASESQQSGGTAASASYSRPDGSDAGAVDKLGASAGVEQARADAGVTAHGGGDARQSGARAAAQMPAVDLDLVARATRAAAGGWGAAVRVPTTSTEFELAWRACRGDAARERAFLRNVPPAALPGVFKSSLTPGVLAGVARAAVEGCAEPGGDEEACRHGLEVLRALPRVERFAMNAMLVSGGAKAALKAAWDAASGEGGQLAADLAELRPLYRV